MITAKNLKHLTFRSMCCNFYKDPMDDQKNNKPDTMKKRVSAQENSVFRRQQEQRCEAGQDG